MTSLFLCHGFPSGYFKSIFLLRVCVCVFALSQTQFRKILHRKWIARGLFPGYNASEVTVLWFSGLPLISQSRFCSTCPGLLSSSAPKKHDRVADCPLGFPAPPTFQSPYRLRLLSDSGPAKPVSCWQFSCIWPSIFLRPSWPSSSSPALPRAVRCRNGCKDSLYFLDVISISPSWPWQLPAAAVIGQAFLSSRFLWSCYMALRHTTGLVGRAIRVDAGVWGTVSLGQLSSHQSGTPSSLAWWLSFGWVISYCCVGTIVKLISFPSIFTW